MVDLFKPRIREMINQFSSTFDKRRWVKIILFLALYLSLLMVFYHFYLKDQVEAFMKKRTSKTIREETAEILEFPTTTICFQTSTKLSVAQKYGMKDSEDIFHQDFANQTLLQTYGNLSFHLGSDFEIQDGISGRSLKYGENHLLLYHSTSWQMKNQTFKFELSSLRTFSSGTCYKLAPKFDAQVTLIPMRFRIKVILSPSLKSIDRPGSVILHFTSNKTDILVADNVKPQFRISNVKVPFKSEITRVYFKAVEKLFDQGHDNNSECLKSAYVAHAAATKCPKACDFLSTTDLPLCKKAEHLQCIWKGYKEDCLMVKKATTYNILSHVTDSYCNELNFSMTEIIFGLWTKQKSIVEDVPVLTLQDLIGSVGGSLGMFFGFSLSATIISFVHRIFQ